MSLTDPIGDMIARIKNAQMRNHKEVDLMIQQSVDAMEYLLVNGLNQTMNKYNS